MRSHLRDDICGSPGEICGGPIKTCDLLEVTLMLSGPFEQYTGEEDRLDVVLLDGADVDGILDGCLAR